MRVCVCARRDERRARMCVHTHNTRSASAMQRGREREKERKSARGRSGEKRVRCTTRRYRASRLCRLGWLGRRRIHGNWCRALRRPGRGKKKSSTRSKKWIRAHPVPTRLTFTSLGDRAATAASSVPSPGLARFREIRPRCGAQPRASIYRSARSKSRARSSRKRGRHRSRGWREKENEKQDLLRSSRWIGESSSQCRVDSREGETRSIDLHWLNLNHCNWEVFILF